MGKRDIEELFKERFKDFREEPGNNVWQSIEASLDKKKQKKRVVPIWWQLGGVAALLAILLYIINPFQSDSDNVQQDTVVDGIEETNGTDRNDKINNAEELAQPSFEKNQTEVVDSENANKNNENAIASDAENEPNQESFQATPSQNDVAISNRQSNSNTSSKVNETPSKNKENQLFNPLDDKKEVLVSVRKPDNTTIENSTEDKNQVSENWVPISEKTTVADNNRLKTDETPVKEKEGLVDNDNKKSIFEAIAEQKDNEETALAKNDNNKWSVGPSVAPVYFSSIGEGSPIHPNFEANTKSGNINLSYGLTVAYNLGKRLTVRSGIHKVDFGYNTDDIVFSSSLATSQNDELDNIDYNSASRNLVVQSKAENENANQFAADLIARSPEFEGRMVQQMGYLEVPVELNYALVDKKFGVDLIGGVSSLFLIDNSVSLESDGLITEMGEANNVNDVNFSTNIGVGLNYEFSPKIQMNLEPVFKYQLNTFSDTAGNFRPFSVGIYSGISLKF